MNLAKMTDFISIDPHQIRFHHPFTMIVSGSTGSGKSEWVQKFFENFHMIVADSPSNVLPISLIIYCYGELNQNITKMQNSGKIGDGSTRLIVHNGLPTNELIRAYSIQTNGHLMVVLDDLMVGIEQEFLDSIFTKGSHNWGVSVILITQHLFAKELKIARNNSHYLILMRNPAGALQIRTLACHLFPTRVSYFLESYADATSKNFGYLLIDMHPLTLDFLRLRTNIYPDDGENTTIYISK